MSAVPLRDTAPMSQQNVDAFERLKAAFDAGDIDTVLAGYSPDTIWDDRKLRPEGAVHRGRDAMRAELSAWFGAWDDYTSTIEELIDAGDRVVAVVRERGVAKRSGVRIDHRIGLVHRFHDGLIVETTVYRDPLEALEAVGESATP
jgi:ketosteroid isomerase-like protein